LKLVSRSVSKRTVADSAARFVTDALQYALHDADIHVDARLGEKLRHDDGIPLGR